MTVVHQEMEKEMEVERRYRKQVVVRKEVPLDRKEALSLVMIRE